MTTREIPARRPLRVFTTIIVYAAVIGAAAGTAYYATRGRIGSLQAPAGHDHGAAASGGGAAQPIRLTLAEGRRIGVTFAVATVGSFGREVRTVGQVAIDESRISMVTLRIDGWVEQLFVNVTGQRVEKGQPLLAVYSPMLITAQEELLLAGRLQSDVAGASAEVRAGANQLLASARRRLEYWGVSEADIAEIERSGESRRTVLFRAPANGYVIERNVTAGERIMSGDVLYKMADLSTVWIDGEVFEQDLAVVRSGQPVRVELDALPGEARAGVISNIYPTLDPDTRTVRVRIVMANAGLRLKPGMYATIRIAGTKRAGVLTVPRSAVLSTGERSIVFVQGEDGQLAPRAVVAGASNDDRTEILGGLAAGETVVASATFLVNAESNLGRVIEGMNEPRIEAPGLPPSAQAPPPTSPPATQPAHVHEE